METTAVNNGITRYAVVSQARSGNGARKDTPPLAQEFLGNPKVTVDVHNSGRVDFFVSQEVRIIPRRIILKDNHRIKVPRHGHISVKHYPSSLKASNGIGPKVPPLWASSREVSSEVLSILQDASSKLMENVDPSKAHFVRDALVKLGITPREVSVGQSQAVTSLKDPISFSSR